MRSTTRGPICSRHRAVLGGRRCCGRTGRRDADGSRTGGRLAGPAVSALDDPAASLAVRHGGRLIVDAPWRVDFRGAHRECG